MSKQIQMLWGSSVCRYIMLCFQSFPHPSRLFSVPRPMWWNKHLLLLIIKQSLKIYLIIKHLNKHKNFLQLKIFANKVLSLNFTRDIYSRRFVAKIFICSHWLIMFDKRISIPSQNEMPGKKRVNSILRSICTNMTKYFWTRLQSSG